MKEVTQVIVAIRHGKDLTSEEVDDKVRSALLGKKLDLEWETALMPSPSDDRGSAFRARRRNLR